MGRLYKDTRQLCSNKVICLLCVFANFIDYRHQAECTDSLLSLALTFIEFGNGLLQLNLSNFQTYMLPQNISISVLFHNSQLDSVSIIITAKSKNKTKRSTPVDQQ